MVAATYIGKPCRRGHDGLRYKANTNCVQCLKGRMKAQYKKDPARALVRSTAWRKANPEKARASVRQWERENPERGLERGRRWSKKNPAYIRAKQAKRRAVKLRATLPGFDGEIRAFYEACPPGMTVDHIVPLQGKNICGLHVPWNLQYLTGPENSAKGNKFDDC